MLLLHRIHTDVEMVLLSLQKTSQYNPIESL